MLVAKRSAGVAPEVNLRNPLHAGEKARKRGIRPSFETLPEVQSMAPQKKTRVLKNFF